MNARTGVAWRPFVLGARLPMQECVLSLAHSALDGSCRVVHSFVDKRSKMDCRVYGPHMLRMCEGNPKPHLALLPFVEARHSVQLPCSFIFKLDNI